MILGGFEGLARIRASRSEPVLGLASVKARIEVQTVLDPPAVTRRLQFRKFTPVNERSSLFTLIHESVRTHFVHSREPT